MKKIVRAFLGLLGIGLLALVLMPISEHHAAASGSAPVSVTNTPLPVQGTVGVNNLPAVQSVNGTVSVGNTPSVNVANTPTVSLAGGSNLNVSNPLDSQNNPSPLVTLEAAQPYEDRCAAANSNNCTFQTIPTGKRLVIQEVDTFVALNSPNRLSAMYFNDDSGLVNHSLVPILITDDGTTVSYQSHQETHLYVVTGTTPYCYFAPVSLSPVTQFVQCAFSGFLEDTP